MSVVIDDFEVLANDEERSQTTGSSAVNSNGATSLTAHDLESVVERQCERHERVWAH